MYIMQKSVFTLIAGIAIVAASSTWAQAPADRTSLERWRQYNGVSWTSEANTDAVNTRFSGSVTAPIVGLHFDKSGSAYVSTPRLLSPDAPATLSILDLNVNGGPARLTAFPTTAGNAINGPVASSLRNVLGFHVDQRNGWLWALDMGFVAGETEAPAGAQKLLVFDIKSGKTLKSIPLDSVADRKGSFLNDIAVDEKRKIAYISDSGFRSAPNNLAGIIVAEFASARVRRVLHQHPTVQIEADTKVYAHGEEVWPNNPLLVAINGIALSPDTETLYWTVTAGTQLHAMPTAVLRNFRSSESKIAAAVRKLGKVDGNTDGIVTDRRGNLYITDVTHNGIARFDASRKHIKLIASDPGVFWPDTITVGPNEDLFFTASNLNNHFAGTIKDGQERYEIWRLPNSATKQTSQ